MNDVKDEPVIAQALAAGTVVAMAGVILSSSNKSDDEAHRTESPRRDDVIAAVPPCEWNSGGPRDQGDAAGHTMESSETPGWNCEACCHECPLDALGGCPSCHRTCHDDCKSDLCAFEPCGFCLSPNLATHENSGLWVEAQMFNM